MNNIIASIKTIENTRQKHSTKYAKRVDQQLNKIYFPDL